MRGVKHLRQSGFTLIELIIVIVIVGILAAVALPEFFNLTTDAKQAAADAIAGNLAAAANSNFALRSGFPTRGTAVAACDYATATALLETVPPAAALTMSGLPAACLVTLNGTAATSTFDIKVIP